MTQPVILPPDLEAFVVARIAAGDYASVDEAVRAAFELLKKREEGRARLDAAIDEGFGEPEERPYLFGPGSVRPD